MKNRFILYDKYLNRKDVTRPLLLYLFISTFVNIGFLFLIGGETIVLNKVKYIPQETKVVILRENNKFSKQKLKQMLKDMKVKFPKIVMAQAIVETGNFKSHIFKENNNLFGMKLASSRPSTARGVLNNHAYYNTWQESVQDYVLFQTAFLREVRTENEYLEYLGSYAQSPKYRDKVKIIMQKIK